MLEDKPFGEQMAWLAAMLDGEGCISAYAFPAHRKAGMSRKDGTMKYRVKLLIAVTNTSEAIIAEVRRLFAVVGETNPVVHVHKIDRTKQKQCWRVHITSNGPVSRVLQAVRPWLVAKHGQADLVLAIAAHRERLIAKYGKKATESRVENDTWLREQLGSLRTMNLKGPRKEVYASL